MASLLAAIKEREARRDVLRAQLAVQGVRKPLGNLDIARLVREARTRLTDWQGLIGRHPAQARQILGKLLRAACSSRRAKTAMAATASSPARALSRKS